MPDNFSEVSLQEPPLAVPGFGLGVGGKSVPAAPTSAKSDGKMLMAKC